MRKFILACAVFCRAVPVVAQQHNFSDRYVVPRDSAVREKLAAWQDLKFGLMMHWGTYSEWGIVESWSLCPEDEGWTQRRGPYAANYFDYVRAYENLQTTFNPVKFDPEKWADAAKDAGMRYVVFTTKHHDGFCMFDTQETDYKVTSKKTPFSSNPKSNVAREVFDAFRDRGFMTGAYFSKPDWHCPYYWWPYFPPKDRNVNYDPARHPDRWNQFKSYTYNQIRELMTGYGKMDILWLDGGWVRPLSTVDTTVDWQRGIHVNQDIDMPSIAQMARERQPGLLIVDRTVAGEYENYVTPEQTVPETPLARPWESCITMGNSWSYVPNDAYKSSRKIVQLLLRIVSRGGNLLLNVGPSPEGDWSDTAYTRLREIGAWMKINGDGIYNTVPLAPYEQENIVYLQSKDQSTRFAYLLATGDNDAVMLPEKLILPGLVLEKGTQIGIAGAKRINLRWHPEGGGTAIEIPASLRGQEAGKYAVAFVIRRPGS